MYHTEQEFQTLRRNIRAHVTIAAIAGGIVGFVLGFVFRTAALLIGGI